MTNILRQLAAEAEKLTRDFLTLSMENLHIQNVYGSDHLLGTIKEGCTIKQFKIKFTLTRKEDDNWQVVTRFVTKHPYKADIELVRGGEKEQLSRLIKLI